MTSATPQNLPATIEEAMQYQAQILIDAFSDENSPIDGTQLDYSQSSLMLVDQILHDFYIEQAPLPDDLHFITSCYVFETLRQNLGGRYLRSDSPNDFILIIGDSECEIICLVMERVWACAQAWETNNMVTFYDAIKTQLMNKQNVHLGAIPI